MGGVAIPSFWQALLLVYVFAVLLRWVPPSGLTSPFVDPLLSAKMLVLPAIVLGTHSAAVIMRQGRSALMASRQSGAAIDPTDDLLVMWAEGGNSAYHRAKVPGLIDTLHQADAEYDQAKRQALFVQAQKLMYDSAWFGYIWFEPGNFLVHKRIQGFPAAWGPLRESEWWINDTSA